MAKDISAVGARVTFSGGSLDGLVISEFSEEGTPFDCPDVDVSTNEKNLNGEMISSRTPSVYPFSITVIPGSYADAILHRAFAKNALNINNNASEDVDYVDSVTITMPRQVARGSSGYQGGSPSFNTTVTFTNVRMKSGPTGPSTSAEGRMAARTYSFEAENFI